jgi:hypothetical protein
MRYAQIVGLGRVAAFAVFVAAAATPACAADQLLSGTIKRRAEKPWAV